MRMAFLLAALGCSALAAQTQSDAKLAPYYPTPETIVEKMLQLGGLKAGEKVYDLGSGDGRIVLMAAQKFHADAVGIEIDKDLCRQSADKHTNERRSWKEQNQIAIPRPWLEVGGKHLNIPKE